MKLSFIFLATVILCSMQQVLGQFGNSYVALVVDNTGSMTSEISAVKTWLTNCVNGVYPDCSTPPSGGWILSTFNDPGVGPTVGPTTNLLQIISSINSLTATGGGDCPELAMQGILNALPSIPPPPFNSGCKIFFFTDASAKDSSLLNQVKTQIIQKDCTFIPILTGCCGGVCQDPCLTLPPSYCENNVVNIGGTLGFPSTKVGADKEAVLAGETSALKAGAGETLASKPGAAKAGAGETLYYNLAHATGGKILLANKLQPAELLSFLEKEVKIVSCPTDKIAGPLPMGFDKEKCKSTKSCWDGEKKKCFCQGADKCPKIPLPTCTSTARYSFYPDPLNCSMYYLCGFGKRYHLNCRKGTVFNPKLLRCDSPSNVSPPCGTGKISVSLLETVKV